MDYEHRIAPCVRCEYDVCVHCSEGMEIAGCKFCEDMHPRDIHKSRCGYWEPFFPISIGL